MELDARELSWDGCVNVRDLGGLGQTRPGAVVRMEAAKHLTEAGWAAAWAYGVRTVVDLRDADERDADERDADGRDGDGRDADGRDGDGRDGDGRDGDGRDADGRDGDGRDGDGREPDRVRKPAGITTVHVPLDPVGTPFYEHWKSIDNTASPLYYPAMLAEQPQSVIAAVRAIAGAAPGCVIIHCAGGKDRTGLVALVLLTLAGATPGEMIADYLLSYDRLKPRFDAVGVRDQLTAVTELLASHGTTIATSLTSTIASLRMPDFLLQNGLSDTELAALRTRLTT